MRDYIHFCEISIIERNCGVLFIYEGRLPFLEDDRKFVSYMVDLILAFNCKQSLHVVYMAENQKLVPNNSQPQVKIHIHYSQQKCV